MFRQIPNFICLLRIALVVPVVYCMIHERHGETLLLFAVAAVSDGLDGFLAKRFGWQTDVGAILDPAADKLLLVAVFVTLGLLGLVPIWLAILVIVRDLVIVIGAGAYRYWFGPVNVQPRVASKINTACQLTFVLAVIARQGFSQPPDWVVMALGASVLVMTVVSGLDYVMTYIARARVVAKNRRLATRPL
jgi:cardiolipin synthase (CMP-forming)